MLNKNNVGAGVAEEEQDIMAIFMRFREKVQGLRDDTSIDEFSYEHDGKKTTFVYTQLTLYKKILEGIARDIDEVVVLSKGWSDSPDTEKLNEYEKTLREQQALMKKLVDTEKSAIENSAFRDRIDVTLTYRLEDLREAIRRVPPGGDYFTLQKVIFLEAEIEEIRKDLDRIICKRRAWGQKKRILRKY